MGKVICLPGAGQVATCERCGDPCKVADKRKDDATMLRLAKEPKGFCANCAVTEWLMLADRTGMIPEIEPKHFLVPAIQAQFAQLMRTAKSDMDPREINWTKVVEHWNLPMPKLDAGVKSLRGRPRRKK